MNIEEKRALWSAIQARENQNEIIDLLENIETEIDLDGATPLNHAVNYDKIDVVKYLLNRGANVNCKQDGTYTPLMSACEGDNIELVKILLEAGADISIKDEYDNNALWKATFNENEDIVKLLLDYGADPQEITKNNKTIYQRAERMDLDSIIKIFDTYKK